MLKPKHISARLTWHADGWNGKICQDPEANTYCTGQYSYPGGMYEKKPLQELEAKKYAGCSCSKISDDYIPPCCFSNNAFGTDTTVAEVNSPEWYTNNEIKKYELPPNTISIWPYEEMYFEDDKNADGTFNYENRINNVKAFMKEVKEDTSLIFYYSNYSNPLSGEDDKKYVIVGFGRVKTIHPYMDYDLATDEERKRYAGAFVWQIPITSNYPEEGFRIPYHKYKDQPEILDKIAFFPENSRNFKYAMRHVSDDDALEVVERALEIVDILQNELQDTSEDWEARKKWLHQVVAELWLNRGKYPGMPQVLNYLDLPELNEYFKRETNADREEQAFQDIKNFLLNGYPIEGINIDEIRLGNVKDELATKDEEEINFILDVLPRFEIEESNRLKQITQIISEDRQQNGLEYDISALVKNPYLLCENYAGNGPDDQITFAKIDHGMLPSLDLGLKPLTTRGSDIRFRALCVNNLKQIAPHTFTAAEVILQKINKYLSFLSDWRQFDFKLKNFSSYKNTLIETIVLRNDADNNLFLYLKTVYEDERLIEEKIRDLTKRQIGNFKSPVTDKNWQNFLYDSKSKIAELNPNEYQEAVKAQAEVCQKIFDKGLSVICGGAGTGKTTVVKSIISGIEKAHGIGTSFLLLAPTGKAADRLRERSGKEAKTIHSFLSERGWMNDNFTYKRKGGKLEENIRIFIIDESSMIDQSLMATLFRAINWQTVQRIIFVGDPNQLPPIGYGKVFADIIKWIPEENKGELKENLRQRENKLEGRGTGILDLASIFIQDDFSDLDLKETATNKAKQTELLKQIQELDFTEELKDIEVHFWDNEKELNELMFNTLVRDLEAEHDLKYNEEAYWELLGKTFEDPEDTKGKKANKFQVISPYRSELFGTDALNTFFQSKLNKRNFEKQNFLDGISIYDKVIQYRNRPKSNPIFAYVPGEGNVKINIYNGELGFTRPHGFDTKKFYDNSVNRWYQQKFLAPSFRAQRFVLNLEGRNAHIPFGKDIGTYQTAKGYTYNLPQEKPIDNLELAYAISVHKSQGSEFDHVFLVLPKNKKTLLSKELIYTAVTRAKTKLTVFAEQDISAFLQLTRPEANRLAKINASLFEFKPIPKELLVMSDWYEEGKIHQTISEYMVRSKSEVIIANMLTERTVPFWYEKPLFASDGSFYLPDFTVMFAGETYYLEHVGRLDLPDYKAHWEKKVKWYQKNFPNRLLTTYETATLSNDIDKIIKELS
ncbi:ATP-dependent DNA helicase [Flavobacterium dankookense]|uniref:ATP-dependent exoDNAse (Exonuclease V) alpha subunit n=1 Tax=Flavobacterium dankookense TaxID=706186 RepID=A0A4R6QFU5_9FLAO|nr:ATP-dependent RecD-like DNA helicase [Flavobacterium dankookense]TDP61177.1 ATP-dependent exoDNAse (exonuclease V) alpha subunit [Flavobacterium dankookense]